MDPNTNRNSMGSRAGTALKPKFGAGTVGAPSRQGTVGRVIKSYILGIKSFRWRRLHNISKITSFDYRRRYKWPARRYYLKKSI
jgi:hypothetical protein